MLHMYNSMYMYMYIYLHVHVYTRVHVHSNIMQFAFSGKYASIYRVGVSAWLPDWLGQEMGSI